MKKTSRIGYFVFLFIPWIMLFSNGEEGAPADKNRTHSMLPILMYDSDIGFGFGGKGVLKNLYQKNESFDLTLFGSTKGEQWYKFSFSIPDAEIRQNTPFPIALDVHIEYDKFLKSNFFGIGNDSKDNDNSFPREFINLELILSRAFSSRLVAEFGYYLMVSSVYGYGSAVPVMSPAISGEGETAVGNIRFRMRWDTRNSQIHPTKGCQLTFHIDLARKVLAGDYTFNRYHVMMSRYVSIHSSSHILAARFVTQHIDGTAPFYKLCILGGSDTARGFKALRFMDNASMLASLEYRFPLVGSLGGVLFSDAGRVFPSIEKAAANGWKANWGFGLRYYLPDFVTRMDIGFSEEGMRLFFNFGQVF